MSETSVRSYHYTLHYSPEELSSQIRTSFEIQGPLSVLKLAPLRRFLHSLAMSSLWGLSVLRVYFSVLIISFVSIRNLVCCMLGPFRRSTSRCVCQLITQYRPVVTGRQLQEAGGNCIENRHEFSSGRDDVLSEEQHKWGMWEMHASCGSEGLNDSRSLVRLKGG